jgi:DNA-directed RNA polymerase sigma subunit (sigma70/sigma32)
MNRQEQLCKWLQTLPPREEYFLRSRFGIGSDADDLLHPDAPTSPLTTQQAQQLELQGLRQLRRALPMIGAGSLVATDRL